MLRAKASHSRPTQSRSSQYDDVEVFVEAEDNLQEG